MRTENPVPYATSGYPKKIILKEFFEVWCHNNKENRKEIIIKF